MRLDLHRVGRILARPFLFLGPGAGFLLAAIPAKSLQMAYVALPFTVVGVLIALFDRSEESRRV